RVFPLYKDTFDILMVGRLSPEKNQKVLIRAVQYSRYAKHIRIFFAGGGADQKMLQTLGSVLPRPPSIHYYSQKELVNLMHSC
ncbi:glycosyltransferase, partial [Klebsiella pneumoniae]|nr:glycosyltransferase [Klebsiella pneumoniae]